MTIELSKRLQSLAEFVPDGARVVDVGCDHAFLIIALTASGRISFAVGTDVADGPYKIATKHVKAAHLCEQISIRYGNGLETVVPGEVNTCIIAGMGGYVMANILRASDQVVNQLKRVILQPMNASHQVRRYLYEGGFALLDERICEEDGRLYEIIVADNEKLAACRDSAYAHVHPDKLHFVFEFGPIALLRRDPLLIQFVERNVRQWDEIIAQMAQSQTDASRVRRENLTHRIKIARQWLNQSTSTSGLWTT